MDVNPAPRVLPVLSRADVQRECMGGKRQWIIINDRVLDVSEFRKIHPGGSDVLMRLVGGDATRAFENAFHSSRAVNMTEKYVVGTIRK